MSGRSPGRCRQRRRRHGGLRSHLLRRDHRRLHRHPGRRPGERRPRKHRRADRRARHAFGDLDGHRPALLAVHEAVDDTIAYRAELPVRVDAPVLSDDPVLWHGLVLPDSWWSDLAGTLDKASVARHRPRRRTAALLAAPPGHRGPRPRRLPRPGQPGRPRRRSDRVRAAAPDRQPRGQSRPQGPVRFLISASPMVLIWMSCVSTKRSSHLAR